MIRRLAGGIAVVCLLIGTIVTAFARTEITGAGAAFPYPIYAQWFDEYAKIDSSVHFDYRPACSGVGQKEILKHRIDFGASEALISDEALARAPAKILCIPTMAGAVVITYNIPDMPRLRLDGETLAAIFLGQITKWNDLRIVALNPSVRLMDLDIVVLHRSDESGLSYILTDYLSKVSHDWKSQVGVGLSVGWPVGYGAKGSEGVLDQIRQIPGSIGYVELNRAVQSDMPYADLKNEAGRFVSSTVDSVAAALAAVIIPPDFRFSMTNSPNPAAYPICGVIWLLIDQQQKDPEKGRKLRSLLKWAETDGQAMVRSFDCAPLPRSLQKKVLAQIDGI